MTAFVKIAAFAAMTVMAVPAQAESPFASLAYLPQISPSAFPVNLPTTKDLVGPITAQLAAIPAPAAGADNLGFTLQEGDGNAATLQQSGQHNIAVIQQSGAFNIASVAQLGNGHSAYVMQSGRGNQAFIAQR